MNCKKCGNEIKEGNEFCTNCGHSLNGTKINILKEYKISIIIIIIWIVIIGVIIGIKAINNKKQSNQTISNNEIVEENTSNNDIEQNNELLVENDEIVEEKSLLEQIELIDPNNEYPVCIGEYGDYTEYWILDSEGKKIHFSDVEGFKNAIEIYKERANNTSDNNDNSNNKQDNSNNSNSGDKQTSNSNNQNTNNNSDDNDKNYIKDNVQDKEDNKLIGISFKQLENKTEQELKNLLTSKGLIPKVVNKTEEIAYSDDLANTTKSTVEIQLGNENSNFYRKGETVEIINTYYKPISWTASLQFEVGGASFNVNGKTCYVDKQSVGRYNAGAYCFFENPLELDKEELYGDSMGKGVKFYINDKLMETGSKGFYEFTFNNVETVTYKIVAPYIYEFDERILEGEKGTMLSTNVVVYEKELNVKELYKNMRGHIVELKID